MVGGGGCWQKPTMMACCGPTRKKKGEGRGVFGVFSERKCGKNGWTMVSIPSKNQVEMGGYKWKMCHDLGP